MISIMKLVHLFDLDWCCLVLLRFETDDCVLDPVLIWRVSEEYLTGFVP